MYDELTGGENVALEVLPGLLFLLFVILLLALMGVLK